MPDFYELVDPRPIAASAPYTYFLPSAARLSAIGKGDFVKVIIRAVPPSSRWDAERMWVKVVSDGPEWLEGTLESEPDDMPNLVLGATIRTPRACVIDIMFDDPRKEAALPIEARRQFWERCLVDQAVLDGTAPVQYVYREEPNIIREGDPFPDSGWRVRGDMRGIPTANPAEPEVAYVALGAVLNRDDTWLHLIDMPVGTAFEKDTERGVFIQTE